MISPNMATTLAYVLTDASVSPTDLNKSLRAAVATSYNRLTVDGDMSTNDTMLILANGASGVKIGQKNRAQFPGGVGRGSANRSRSKSRGTAKARRSSSRSSSKARAMKLKPHRSGAPSQIPISRKTAIAGSDPNWGRILCAAGYAGVEFDPMKTDVWLQGVRVCRKGLAAEYDEAALSKKLDEPDCAIRVVLGEKGPGVATFWTCDLTHDYITINASYRT